jgi:hypothetical protein
MTKKASDLNWATDVVSNLSRNEFPSGVLEHMDARVILALSDLRRTTGRPIFPSPVAGAHVRHTMSGSRHATQGGKRLSDATDFFLTWEDAHAYMEAAREHHVINGIGIYTDMIFRAGGQGTWAMMHIDCRPIEARLEWVGWRETPNHSMIYVYKQRTPAEYNRILNTRGKLSTRV